MISIHPICAFKDNYIWIIIDSLSQEAIVVDPGDAEPILNYLKKNNLKLISILITHKHWDHSGGIDKLKHSYPAISVYANEKENISGVTHFISEGDIISFGEINFKVIEVPGHTLGHVAYYSKQYLFSGDTLFSVGCGRIFEGTALQMLASLKKLSALPDDTLVYCGHEYTLANLKFALHLEPENIDIQKYIVAMNKLREENKPTLPSTMAIEKKLNPFLRCTNQAIVDSVQTHANKKLPIEMDVFFELREWKNSF